VRELDPNAVHGDDRVLILEMIERSVGDGELEAIGASIRISGVL
jgi:hypothetical protein